MSQSVEPGERQELRKIWLTSMRLLGFNSAYEEKVKVALGKDMFSHINKKGSEVVLHYLFSRLDSHMAYEEFRDCWPIFDKKQETQFRRACSNWLAKIAKEDPSSRLPRLASSLLLSPGGDKFYLFLLRFSSYVLKKVCIREAKEEKNVFLSSFVTAPEGHAPALKDVSVHAMQAHTVRHTQNVVKRTLLLTKLHEEWRAYASELVEEYRSCSKEIKQLKKKLESLEEESKRQVQTMGLTGSPRKALGAGLKASEKVLSLSAEVAAQKRHSRMEKVRAMWCSLEGFLDKTSQQREVVSSVLHGQVDEHTIDGKDIIFQVPDMLLAEYDSLSREGKIGNTYEAGQLNIISLIKLWNCSLKVLRDKLLEKELPSLEAELQYITEALQTQRANLATTKNLRVSLMELRLSVETTIAELERNLKLLREKTSFQGRRLREGEREGEGAPVLRMPPIIVPSLDFDLMPPSPKKPLPILASGDQAERQHLPVNLSLRTDDVSTPEAVHNISRSVQHASHQHRPPHQHHQQPPHSASKPQQQRKSKLRAPQVKLGKPGSAALQTGDLSIFNDESPPSHPTSQPQKSPLTANVAVSLKTPRSRLPKPTSSLAVHKVTAVSGRGRGKVDGATRRSQEDKENTTPLPMAILNYKAHDILAEQIAAIVANTDNTPEEGQIQAHAFVDPISAMGTDAFVVRDKIPRTPVTKPVKRAQESASSPVLLQSPSIKSESPKPSMALHTPPVPSLLATDLPSLSPFVQNSAIQTTPVHNIKTPQTQEKSNLIEFSLSPLQDSKLEAPSKSNSNYSSDGSTTPEPSPLSQQPTSEDQHTPSTVNSSNDQDSTPSLQHNTSVASSSRKVAFSIEGVAPASMSSQLGLFSPGSLHQTGLSFQTPPSGSYQLMSELPPTPFQDANFDLDSSSNEEEEEEEEQQQLSRESGSSFDSSYFRQLHQRVLPLISQEDIEGSSDHKLEGVVSRTDREEPQAKLVPTDSQPPKNCHDRGVLDSANSLKVDDLLGLNSPGTSQLLSPQVGLLVDTPGSNILGKPLLTSTVQGNQEVSTTSQEQRGQVPSPTSDILLPYLPSHSGTQSGALISASSVDTECTWSSLMNTNSGGSPFLVSTASNVSESKSS